MSTTKICNCMQPNTWAIIGDLACTLFSFRKPLSLKELNKSFISPKTFLGEEILTECTDNVIKCDYFTNLKCKKPTVTDFGIRYNNVFSERVNRRGPFWTFKKSSFLELTAGLAII